MQDNNFVLVVDDDPGMLEGGAAAPAPACLWIHLVFIRAGFQKTIPTSSRRPCVILDINLLDGSGIELREDLTAAGLSVVIFITGNSNPNVRDAAVASGCVAFLTKPFSSRELIEPLKRAPGGRT
jgi:FixJ family two-component response regulator